MLNSISSSGNLYGQLIDQIISAERAPARRLEAQRSDQKVFKGVLSDFDTTLSDLEGALNELTDPFSNPLSALSATTGDGVSAFSVTAGENAPTGPHTLEVQQLAQADTRVSQSYASDEAGTDSLRSFFDANGAQTFSISVASPTDADPANREDISVTVDPVGTTNEEILDEVSAAVNTAMATAVDNGTISASDKASMSLVNETSSTSRLSIRSSQTGYTNRLQFTDSAGGLLNTLQITQNDTTTDDGSGGQVYDVGTSETDSALNSQFVLDGLTLYRDSNTVEDALDGVTLTLQETNTQAETFTIAPDEESITQTVESFIEKYNSVLDFIKNKSNIDAESDTRGQFAGETGFRSLRFNLRSDAVQPVSGQPDGAPSRLSDIGITVDSSGRLELSDSDDLTAAISANADAVQSLFASDDGVGTRMLQRVERYTASDGILNRRKQSIDRGIRRLDDRIDRFDTRLERRRERLQEQFAEVQKLQQQLQNQNFGF